MNYKQDNNVITGILTKMEEEILDSKKCRPQRIDLEELGMVRKLNCA